MKHLSLLFAGLLAAPLWAGDMPQPPKGDMPPPPRLDTASCKGKAAGTVVKISTPDGRSMKATCQLVAVPERPEGPPPGEGGQKPPKDAKE